MSFSIIVPARLHSTRLSKKLIRRVGGKTILQYVYENCLNTNANRIIIATDSDQIQEIARSFGAEVVMTPDTISSGTERVAYVAAMQKFPCEEVVVNVQGDDPHLPVSVINAVALRQINHRNHEHMSSAAAPIVDPTKLDSPHVVKVVCCKNSYALYFSRYPIPFVRDDARDQQRTQPCLQHLGIYAYRVAYLKQFYAYPKTELEQIEMLEQLRALWHGDRIGIHLHPEPLASGIDTKEDLDAFSSKIGALDTLPENKHE